MQDTSKQLDLEDIMYFYIRQNDLHLLTIII